MPGLPDIRVDASGAGGREAAAAALALAVAAGRSLELVDAGALGEGLLGRVRAAASLGGARVEGAEPASKRVELWPSGAPAAGDHTFDAGADGDVWALFAALVPALAHAGGASRIVVRGANHAPGAAGFHDLALGLAPLLAKVGVQARMALGRAAFAPAIDGALTVELAAGPGAPLVLRRRAMLRGVTLVAASSGLPAEAGVRLSRAAAVVLRGRGVVAEEEGLSLPHGEGRGATLTLRAAYERIDVTFSASVADPAEADAAGRDVAARFLAHHESGGALDARLAAFVLPLLALASAGLRPGPTPIHRVAVSRIDRALVRVGETVAAFLPVDAVFFGREGEPGEVRVAPRGVGELLALHPPGD
jgi:RNA 3'-terminal phosphate cyclase (ATP)